MAQTTNVNISTSTILRFVVIVLILGFLFLVRDVLLVLFVALVLAAAIDPSITLIERRGIPRGVGIAIIYLGLLTLIALIVILFVPLVADQVLQFTSAFPQVYAKGFAFFEQTQNSAVYDAIQKSLQAVNDNLDNITKGIFSGVYSIFGGFISFVGILVLTFYLTMEEKGMKRLAIAIAPVRHQPYLIQLFSRIEDRLASWLLGQLTLGLIIAVMTFIGLFALGVKFSIVLALIAGVTELVPIVGPFIGAVPAVIVALSQSPILALWVLILYLIIQQLENHLIVPRVMAKASGLNPVIVIIAILIGSKVAGITGIILAVPTMIIITTFMEDFLAEKKNDDVRLETPAKV